MINDRVNTFQAELQDVVSRWQDKRNDDWLCPAEIVGVLEFLKAGVIANVMVHLNPHLFNAATKQPTSTSMEAGLTTDEIEAAKAKMTQQLGRSPRRIRLHSQEVARKIAGFCLGGDTEIATICGLVVRVCPDMPADLVIIDCGV